MTKDEATTREKQRKISKIKEKDQRMSHYYTEDHKHYTHHRTNSEIFITAKSETAMKEKQEK